MTVSVCLSVSLSASISPELDVLAFEIIRACYRCRGSVLLLRCRDRQYTSGFMDDVILMHKPKQLNVAAQLKHSPHAASSLTINGA